MRGGTSTRYVLRMFAVLIDTKCPGLKLAEDHKLTRLLWVVAGLIAPYTVTYQAIASTEEQWVQVQPCSMGYNV